MSGFGGRVVALFPLAGRAFSLAVIVAVTVQAETSAQAELLAELEAFEAERAAYRRLLPGRDGLTPAALDAYREALLSASGRWVERWPSREFAWRARLQALLGIRRQLPSLAELAVTQALETGRRSSGLAYAEPLEMLAARVLVHHRTNLDEARRLAVQGLRSRLDFLERLQGGRAGDTTNDMDERARTWRWKAALILVRAAAAERDVQSWRAALADLVGSAPHKPATDDRDAAIVFSTAWSLIHRQRARLALAEQKPDEAIASFQLAVSLRPAFPGKVEPPDNQSTLGEALAAWLAAGRTQDEWTAWVSRQKGFPIPRGR